MIGNDHATKKHRPTRPRGVRTDTRDCLGCASHSAPSHCKRLRCSLSDSRPCRHARRVGKRTDLRAVSTRILTSCLTGANGPSPSRPHPDACMATGAPPRLCLRGTDCGRACEARGQQTASSCVADGRAGASLHCSGRGGDEGQGTDAGEPASPQRRQRCLQTASRCCRRRFRVQQGSQRLLCLSMPIRLALGAVRRCVQSARPPRWWSMGRTVPKAAAAADQHLAAP